MERKEGNLNGKRWTIKNGRGRKGNEQMIFFFFACHFLKPLKFVWVYQNGQFLPGKSKFHAGKKWGKVTLPPLENIPGT